MVKIKSYLEGCNRALSVYSIYKAFPDYSYGSLIRIIDLLELMGEIKTYKVEAENSKRILRMVELKEVSANGQTSEV